MSSVHAISRTSPKGGPFLGTCMQCGQTDLSMSEVGKSCENPANLSQDEGLVIAIDGPEIGSEHTDHDLLAMLTGRARFLRDRGEVKSPELIEAAAHELGMASQRLALAQGNNGSRAPSTSRESEATEIARRYLDLHTVGFVLSNDERQEIARIMASFSAARTKLADTEAECGS